MKKRLREAALILAAPALGLGSLPTSAQSDAGDADPAVDEVIVTAQKRSQSLQDVPISITALDSKALDENMITGLGDYFQRTPNVSFSNNGNRARSQIAIRGVGNIGGRANSFGVYIDEFNIAPTSSLRTYDPNLVDIERVEVLRGPQGTFFGRNATGGALSITTRKPGNSFEAEGAAEYGRYDAWLVRGAVNVPLGASVAVRASGYLEETEGFVENIGPAGGSSDLDANGQRLALRFTPSDALTLDLVASHSDYEHGANAVVTRDPLTLGVPPRPWTSNTNVSEFATNAGELYTAHLEYVFGSASLVSVTGYIDNHYREFSDDDASPAPLRIDDSNTQLRSFSQELRLQSDDERAFEWLVGVIYADDWQSIHSKRDAETGANLLNNTQVEETAMHAGFADVTWHASDRLSVILGGRYTKSQYDRSDVRLQPVLTESPLLEQDDSDFAPRLVLTQEWTPALTTYVGASKGFKAGAASGIVPVGANPLFGKETLWNYEVGAKAAVLDGRLRVNSAVFHMDWSDLQVRATSDPGSLLFFVQNAAEASSQGVELELLAEPLPGLELTANAGYLKAEFDEFRNAQSRNTIVDLSGFSLPFAPEWTLGATGQYSFGVGAWNAFARAEWSFTDTVYRDPDAEYRLRTFGDRTFVIPDYDILNLRAGFETERFSMVAFLENALDEEYYTGVRGSTLVDPHPRRYGVQLTVRIQ